MAAATGTHQMNRVSTSMIATIVVVAGFTFLGKATEADISEKTYIHQQFTSFENQKTYVFYWGNMAASTASMTPTMAPTVSYQYPRRYNKKQNE